MPNIAVILGHPDGQSLSSAIARAYAKGARDAGATVREVDLAQLAFDPVLWHGYNAGQSLEPDLIEAQQTIEWADVLVLAYPTWWGRRRRYSRGSSTACSCPGSRSGTGRPRGSGTGCFPVGAPACW